MGPVSKKTYRGRRPPLRGKFDPPIYVPEISCESGLNVKSNKFLEDGFHEVPMRLLVENATLKNMLVKQGILSKWKTADILSATLRLLSHPLNSGSLSLSIIPSDLYWKLPEHSFNHHSGVHLGPFRPLHTAAMNHSSNELTHLHQFISRLSAFATDHQTTEDLRVVRHFLENTLEMDLPNTCINYASAGSETHSSSSHPKFDDNANLGESLKPEDLKLTKKTDLIGDQTEGNNIQNPGKDYTMECLKRYIH